MSGATHERLALQGPAETMDGSLNGLTPFSV